MKASTRSSYILRSLSREEDLQSLDPDCSQLHLGVLFKIQISRLKVRLVESNDWIAALRSLHIDQKPLAK